MKRLYLVSILLLSCVVAFLQADLVDISGLGTVEGAQNGRLIEYLGIPYAEPPVGANRFKAPQPVQPWSNTFKADRRVACIQSMPSFITQDEDCLVINVFRSVNSISSAEKLPVLLWIHGGSWRTGSGLEFFQNASRYVEEGLIFVSFNYRLDMLSYLSHKALTEEDPSNPTNFGLLDQRMAIEWVSKYISSFNGDPNRITVMGLSAGAQSIVIHMQSFQEYKPKFHKAIIMSAYPSVTTIYLNQAEEIGERVVKELGCDYKRNEQVMECLRGLPAEEIMMTRTLRTQFFGTTWRETMLYINDGANFKGSPRVFTNGKYNLDIPVIIGATADEGTFFAKIAFPVQSISEHLYISLLAGFSHSYVQQNPAIIQTLLSNYTSTNPAFGDHPDPFFAVYSALVGDSYFLCPSLNLLKALSKRQAVFGYLYTHVTNDFTRGLGAHHGGDAKFVFGADATTAVTFSEEERVFANNVVTYFSKFVKTGTPGGLNLPAWPIYAPTGKLMSLEPSLKVIEHYKEETCAFWEQNFPTGVAYTGSDYFNPIDESFISKLVNKYPFVVLLFLWRKRRFAMPTIAVLSIASALFWYKVITKCCCRRNKDNNNKKNDKVTAATQKKKTQ